AFAINVLFENGSEEHYSRILVQIEREIGGLRSSISGVPVFRTKTEVRAQEELATFVPMTVLALGVLLYIGIGSLHSVVFLLLTSAAGIWITAGSMGAADR